MINDKHIEILNFNINKSIIEYAEYNNLFEKIHQYYKIDKDILHILLDLNLFQWISNITIKYQAGRVEYIIPENPTLNKNYQNSNYFKFASYALYDKNFKVKSKKINYILFNNEGEIKTALETINVSESFDIYYKVEFNENLIIPYDTNLLNKKEKQDLKNTIMKQEEEISKELIDCNIEGVQYFEFHIKLHNHKTVIETHKEIKAQCEQYYDYYLSLLNEFKEFNKVFFERALTEIQIENF